MPPENNTGQFLKNSHSLTLNAQVHQSLKILQMSAFELQELAKDELNTNPLLEEIHDSPKEQSDELDFSGSIDSIQHLPEKEYEPSYLSLESVADKHQFFFDSIPIQASRFESLSSQAILFDMDETEKKAFEFLVGSLDESGFWKGTLVDLANASKLPVSAFQKAWLVLKELDPPGLGARDLRECLLLQLRREENKNSLAETLVRDHFPLVLHNKLKEMLDETEASPEELNEALAVIGSLNPAPGRTFSDDATAYVVPDIIVFKDKKSGEWQAQLSSEGVPHLRISQEYKQLVLNEKLNEETRNYLKERIRSGRDFISAIKQRQETLGKIAEAILVHQQSFFDQGPVGLKPLTMSTIAENLGVHETTISRAIANKYLRCGFGLFPLKYFFTGGFTSESGETMANTAIKEKIADLVASEDPANPFSDAEIASQLAKTGVKIARRTVSKYRESLDIPAAYLRKK